MATSVAGDLLQQGTGESIVASRMASAMTLPSFRVVRSGLEEADRTWDVIITDANELMSPGREQGQFFEYAPYWKLISALTATASGFIGIQTARAFLSWEKEDYVVVPMGTFSARISFPQPAPWWRPVEGPTRLRCIRARETHKEEAVERSPVAGPEPFPEAQLLRGLTRLDLNRLGKVFGVSRQTYHKWISRSMPKDERREHLLEVLTLLEEAYQRLGGTDALKSWLLRPVSPGGKKPIDYLASKEYSVFRGFLLRVPSDERVARPVTQSSRPRRELSREAFEKELNRLGRRAWMVERD